MKKIALTLSVIFSIVLITLVSYIYVINKNITILKKTNKNLLKEIKLLDSNFCEGACFNGIKLASLGNNKIKVGEYYKGSVVMTAYNSTGNQPYLVISDSVNNKNILTGVLDTITTNNWEGEIIKKYNTKGLKRLYGKYFFYLTNDKKTHSLDFVINIEVE